MSTGQINATELAASLICSEKTIPEGIRHLQDVVDGSMTLLLLTKDGIYAARDKKGRTPLVIGKKEGAYCASPGNGCGRCRKPLLKADPCCNFSNRGNRKASRCDWIKSGCGS